MSQSEYRYHVKTSLTTYDRWGLAEIRDYYIEMQGKYAKALVPAMTYPLNALMKDSI